MNLIIYCDHIIFKVGPINYKLILLSR